MQPWLSESITCCLQTRKFTYDFDIFWQMNFLNKSKRPSANNFSQISIFNQAISSHPPSINTLVRI